MPEPAPTVGARLARYYDLDLGTDSHQQPDLALYLSLPTSSGGPILELAVGSGRIAVPLAAVGHPVTGVDLDPHMLARAGARAPALGATLVLVEGDITTARLGSRFDLVILALNSLLLLDRPAQRAVLATVAAHLTPAGRAVLDVWLPSAGDLSMYDGRLTLDWVRTDPDTGDRVAKSTEARFDPSDNSAVIATHFDCVPATGGAMKRTDRSDRVHFVGPDELVQLVEQAGLQVEQAGGDYDLSPLRPDSDRVVLLCRLR